MHTYRGNCGGLTIGSISYDLFMSYTVFPFNPQTKLMLQKNIVAQQIENPMTFSQWSATVMLLILSGLLSVEMNEYHTAAQVT